MDTTVKVASATLPLLVILWARYAFQAASTAGWIAWRGRDLFRSAHPRFQFLRGLLLLGSTVLAWTGLQYLPVAEFTAINMLGPVLVTLLAAAWLREPVSRLRWSLVLGAFAGALIVVRPGSGLYGSAVLLPLAAAACYASFQLVTSRLAALENPTTTQFYTGATGAAILSLALAASGIELAPLAMRIEAGQLAMLLAIGMLGTVGHLMLIRAFGYAPASTLMPFLYVQIAAAGFVGWIALGHVPDRWAFAGMGVIAACGAASAWLNLRSPRAPASAVAADTIAE